MGIYHEQGNYRVKIIDAKMGEANNDNRTPQLQLALDLIGIYSDDNQLVDCQKGRYPPIVYLSITKATMGDEAKPGWVAETLASLGFDGNFDNPGQLEGTECDAYCSHGTNNAGKEVERWSISRPRQREVRAPEKKTVRSLNAQFGKLLKKLATDPPPAPPANGAPAVAGATEEKVPF